MIAAPKYLALTGGVGGAKLALGLAQILPPAQLAFLQPAKTTLGVINRPLTGQPLQPSV